MEQRRLHRARAKPLNVLQGFADFRICLIEDVQWWTPKSTFEGGPAGMVAHAGRRLGYSRALARLTVLADGLRASSRPPTLDGLRVCWAD